MTTTHFYANRKNQPGPAKRLIFWLLRTTFWCVCGGYLVWISVAYLVGETSIGELLR